MNAVLQSIVEMLSDSDPALIAAAAKVLGRLAPSEPGVSRALGAALARNTNPAVRAPLLDALASIGGGEAIKHLLPFLGSGGAAGQAAALGLARAGPQVVAQLKRVVERGRSEQRRAAIDALARGGAPAGLAFLVTVACESEGEAAREAAAALRGAAHGFGTQQRRAVASQAKKLLAKKRKAPAATASALRVLGDVGDEAAVDVFLRHASRSNASLVRCAALMALSRLSLPKRRMAAIAKKVLPVLNETDEPNLVRAALELLWKIKLPAPMRKDLRKLLASPFDEVKRYAVQALSDAGGAEAAKELVDCLGRGDGRLAESASSALRRMPEAARMLLGRLDKAKDFEGARQIANILLAHKEKLSKTVARTLAVKMTKLLDKDDARARPHLWLVRAADPNLAARTLLERGRRYRRAKDDPKAERYLRPLVGGELLSDEAKYELTLVLLRHGRHHLARSARADNESLRLIGELVRAGFPVLKHLRSERDIETEHLYYMGFHFAERMNIERTFGSEVLKHLVQKFPRSKLARSAKDKLRIEGLIVK